MARRRIIPSGRTQSDPNGATAITSPEDVLAGKVPPERTPDGRINNCSIANGDDEEHCQICKGACPDKTRLVSLELKKVMAESGAEERHTRARKRFDFEVANAAQLSPLRLDVARVVASVFISDIATAYDRLERELHFGDDASDRGRLVARLARSPANYREAHKLFITAKREREAWEKRNSGTFGGMWGEATKALQEEKDLKIRNKQITDADVSAKAAILFGDEWTAQEIQRYEAKQMVDSLQNLVEAWGMAARALEAMVAKSR